MALGIPEQEPADEWAEFNMDPAVAEGDEWAEFNMDPVEEAPAVRQSPYNQAIPEEVDEEKPDYNMLRGIGESAASLTGHLLKFADKVGDNLGDTLNTGGFAATPGAPLSDEKPGWNWLDGDEYRAAMNHPESTRLLDEYGEDIASADMGYEAHQGWDEGKEVLFDENLSFLERAGAVTDIISWGFETGVVSIPHMIGAVANPPVYLMSRTSDIAESRAIADGIDPKDATPAHMAIGAMTATAVTLLEKFGAQKLLSFGKAGGGGIIKGMKEGAAVEAFTESQQELVEYLGEAYGTKEGATFLAGLERTLQGMVGGGSFGAPAGAASGFVGNMRGDTDLEADAAAVNADPDKAPSAADQAAQVVAEATPGDIAPAEGPIPIDGTIMPDPRDAPVEDLTAPAAPEIERPVEVPVEAPVMPDAAVLPEPDETINAQLEVMDDPATDRKAVYLAPGQPEPAIDPDKHRVIELGDGGMAVVPSTYEGAQTAQKLSAATQMDEATKQAAIAEATGIGGQGKTPGAPAVVVTDPDGTVVQSAVADPAGEVLAAAEAVADTRDADVSIAAPEDVVAERVEVTDLEAGLDPETLTPFEAEYRAEAESKAATEEFKTNANNNTGPLKESMDAVVNGIEAFEAVRQEQAESGAKGRPIEGADPRQRAEADGVWVAIASSIENLAKQGFDVSGLQEVLKTAAGGRRPIISTRDGAPISGRSASSTGAKTNRAPPGGWNSILNGFYKGLETELTKLDAQGPTINQEDIPGTELYIAKKAADRKTKQNAASQKRRDTLKAEKEGKTVEEVVAAREASKAGAAKLKSKMATPPVAEAIAAEPVVAEEPVSDLAAIAEIAIEAEAAPVDAAVKKKAKAKAKAKETPIQKKLKAEAASKAFAEEMKGGARAKKAAAVEKTAEQKEAARLAEINRLMADPDAAPEDGGADAEIENAIPEPVVDDDNVVTDEEKEILAAGGLSPGESVQEGTATTDTDEETGLELEDSDIRTNESAAISLPDSVDLKQAKDKLATAEQRLVEVKAKPKSKKRAADETAIKADIRVLKSDIKQIEDYEESILLKPSDSQEVLLQRQQQEAYDAVVLSVKEEAAAEEAAELQTKVDKIKDELRAKAEKDAAEQAAEITANANKAAGAKPVVKVKGKRKTAMLGREPLTVDGTPKPKKKGKLSIKRNELNSMYDGESRRRTPEMIALEETYNDAVAADNVLKDAGTSNMDRLPTIRAKTEARKALRKALGDQLIHRVDGEIVAINRVPVVEPRSVKRDKRDTGPMALLYEYAALAQDKALKHINKDKIAIKQGRDDATDMMDMVLTEFKDDRITAEAMLEDIYDTLHPKDPFRVLIERMQEVGIQDMEVIMLTDAEMTARIKQEDTAGAYVTYDINGEIVPVIYMNEDAMLSANFGVKTFLHEAMHSFTSEALRENNPIAIKLEALRIKVIDILEAEFGEFGAQDYGFTNVDEFVAEASSNPKFQKLLATVNTGNGTTAWTKFLDLVGNMLGIPVSEKSALAEVMTLSSDLMLTPKEISRSQLNETSPFITKEKDPEYEMTEDEIREIMRGDRMTRVHRSQSNVDAVKRVGEMTNNNTIAKGVAKLIGGAGDILSTVTGLDANEVIVRGGSKFILGSSTQDQIVRRFKKAFDRKDGGLNPLAAYDKISRRKTSIARQWQQRAEKINKVWQTLEDNNHKDAENMAALMQDSTLANVHIDAPFFSEKNRHQWNNKAAQAQHAVMKETFNALSPQARLVYRTVRDLYIEQKMDMRDAARNHLAKSFNVDKVLNKADYKALMEANTVAELEAVDLSALQDLEDTFKESMSTIIGATTIQGPYFPLRRFGDYVVEGRKTESKIYADRKTARAAASAYKAADPTNKAKAVKTADGKWEVIKDLREVHMFETAKAANAHRDSMNKRGYTGARGSQEVNVTKKDQWNAPPGTGAATLLSQTKNKFSGTSTQDTAVTKALDAAFIEMLLDSSIRKSELKRRNVKGASKDMRRGFAERAFATSWAIGDLTTAIDHHQALVDMKKTADAAGPRGVELGEVVAELKMRDESGLGDRKTKWYDQFLSKFGFIWYLFSPSYAVVNATQVPLVALPYLSAKYGMKESVAALKESYGFSTKLAAKEMVRIKGGWEGAPTNLLDDIIDHIRKIDPDAAKMLVELTDLGIVDATFMQELYETAQGKKKSVAGQAMETTLDFARGLPQVVEITNRVVVARAAYNLEKANGGTHEQATEAASEAVLQTQFDYSDQNKPRYFKSIPLARPLMMFKMYGQGMYALIVTNFMKGVVGKAKTKDERKLARRTLAGVILTHSLTAGVLGGVAMEPVRFALWLFYNAWGEDEDDIDLDRSIREFLEEYLGKTAGEAIARGLPRLWGMDLSGRVGLDNMALMPMRDARSNEEWYTQFLISLGGPVLAATQKMYRGTDYFGKGEIAKGIENVTPKFVRDIVKTERMVREGLTDYSGNVIKREDSFSGLEVGWQAMGFTPASVAETYESRSVQKKRDRQLTDRRKALMQEWRRSDNAVEFFQQEILPFNSRNRDYNIALSQLFQSKREQRRKEMFTRGGAYTDKAKTRQLGELYNTD